MIEKKIHYVWIGNAEKPKIFHQCIQSWKEQTPDYEIIEINETNFDISYHIKNNKFFRACYERKLWAYMSDYMRIHYLYEHGGIYVDTDMEFVKDITPVLEGYLFKENNKNTPTFISGYEDEKYVSAGIFAASKRSKVLKDMMLFYEDEIWEKPLWTIPKIFTYILEQKYGLTDKRENILIHTEETILLYPKECFYPYGHKETFSKDCITENTFTIHWWNDSWSSLAANLFLETKHLTGLRKIYKKCRIFLRMKLKKKKSR